MPNAPLSLQFHAGAITKTLASIPEAGSSLPTIGAFSPSTGPVATLVFIVGTNFTGTTQVRFMGGAGTNAVTFTVLSNTSLSVVVPAGATTGTIRITNASGNVTSVDTYTVGTATATRFLSRTNPTTSTTTSLEYPRGITSTYDVNINETTGTVTGTLWDVAAERVGAAKHSAIPGGNRITITLTGSAGWDAFKTARTTAAAGTGNWEIIVPNGVLQMDGTYDLSFPLGRRLFITCATLQTADAMPSLTGAFCTFDGPNFSRGYLIGMVDNNSNITFTGIRIRANAAIGFYIVGGFNAVSPTVVGDLPNEIVFDRCVVDGNNRNDIRRGMLVNIRKLAVLETYILDISLDSEASGIGGWTGCAYHYFKNVYIEAAGIAVLYGGVSNTGVLSNTFEPRDVMMYRVAAAKRAKWMPGVLFDGVSRTIKNGFESKNVQRWTMFECATVRHRDDLGQSFAMIHKNSDQDQANLTNCQTRDVITLRHDFYQCSNGFSVLGRGGAEVNPLRFVGAVDLLFRDLGVNAAASNPKPWSFQGEVDNMVLDRWTVLNEFEVGYGYPYYGSGGASDNLWVGNMVLPSGDGLAGGPASTTTTAGTEGLRTVWASGANSYVAGMVFFGPNALFNKAAAYPTTTEYATYIAVALNKITGAITGDAVNKGIGGSVPGANVSAISAFVAAMPWAYNR